MTHTAFCDVQLPGARPWLPQTTLTRALADLYVAAGHTATFVPNRKTLFCYLDRRFRWVKL